MINIKGRYVKNNDAKSPYIGVQKLIILDEEVNMKDPYLMDTGCDYDVAISEIFVSQATKAKLLLSHKGTIEHSPDGREDKLLTYGEIVLNKNYSKKVLIGILLNDSFEGEKIIGIGVINDFVSTLDPFEDKITLVR